jgi:ADP-heptose:LPS heptosyltransferase
MIKLIDKILARFDTKKYKIINKKKLLLTFILDKFLNLFNRPKSRFIDEKSFTPRKILIVRLAYIGDVILSIPAINSISRHFKDSKVILLTNPEAAKVLEKNDGIDRIISFYPFWFYRGSLLKKISEYIKIIKILRAEKFDLAIDLRGDIRNIFFTLFLSGSKFRAAYPIGGGDLFLTDIVPFNGLKHKLDFHLDIAAYFSCKVDRSVEISLTEKEKEIAQKKITKKLNYLNVGIHPGARKELKCYPMEKLLEAINLISKEYRLKLYIFAAQGDKTISYKIMSQMESKDVEIINKISIRELCAYISSFDYFICNDSAPLHIASAFDIPTVAIFGPSKSLETGPISKLSRIVEVPLSCRNSCDEDICENSVYHECMQKISPAMIFEAFKELVDSSSMC